MIWHNTEIEKVLNEFGVDQNKGLFSGVADERISIYGKNSINVEHKTRFIKYFFNAFNTKLNYILTIVALLSIIIDIVYKEGSIFSPIFIISILIINSLVTAYYRQKSVESIDSLNSCFNPNVSVLRDGITKQIPSDFLVPGDIIFIKEGDYITADARLIESANLRTNEVTVTGENFYVDKHADQLFEDLTPIKLRANMIYAGSSVVSGSGKAIVVETARTTEIGKTTEILEQTGSEKLPINDSLEKIEKGINIAVVLVCFLIFMLEILNNINTSLPFAYVTVKMLSNAVALAVAAIPESLPAISIIVVALGINRIVNKKIMVKRIKVLELLGKTNIICTNKTGIITKRVMHLSSFFDGENIIPVTKETINEKINLVLKLSAVCSTLENDSTEQAIEEACMTYCNVGKNEIENIYPRLSVINFDNERKTMTSINMINSSPLAIVKGAPEILIDKCINIDKEKLKKVYEQMCTDGQRVICIALKSLFEIPANPSPDDIECDLTFAAFLGFDDPPRSGAVEGIKICNEAGIKTVMVTADSLPTAISVAKQVGILTDSSEAISGEELSNLSDEELNACIDKYSVFARITPKDKLRIISAWQSKGKLVTVTGNSVDDTDALNAADVGCVMGSSGTDIARGTADLIIEENNFKFLVHAINESRGLFDNIKKAICYLLGCNLSELLIYIVCLLVFGIAPIAAVQLLLLNLLTDCAPSISLSIEKPERYVMKKKPTTLSGRLFDFNSILSVTFYGIFMTLTAFIAFVIGKNLSGNTCAVTMTFATMSFSQIIHSYNIKSNESIFKTDLKSNTFMNYSTLISLFICMFLCLTPAGFVLDLTVLTSGQFFISLGLSLLVIPFGELQKLFLKKHEL